MTRSELSRMIEWLCLAFAFYLISILLRSANLEPQIQTIAWKLGNTTVAAYMGYWLDRRAFKRIVLTSAPQEQLRRAVIMAAAMLAVCLGL